MQGKEHQRLDGVVMQGWLRKDAFTLMFSVNTVERSVIDRGNADGKVVLLQITGRTKLGVIERDIDQLKESFYKVDDEIREFSDMVGLSSMRAEG